jgi:hypothetical protein
MRGAFAITGENELEDFPVLSPHLRALLSITGHSTDQFGRVELEGVPNLLHEVHIIRSGTTAPPSTSRRCAASLVATTASPTSLDPRGAK